VPPAGARLVVYAREGCGLCDEMVAEVAAWLAGRSLEAEVRDVDADAATRARYGLKVPVLTLDGAPVCSGHFDPDALDGLVGT
jgi:flavoprotein